jgi:cbb3-type cytochrome oxidase subunit 3
MVYSWVQGFISVIIGIFIAIFGICAIIEAYLEKKRKEAEWKEQATQRV